jgi:hypothetical protein
MKIQIQIVSLAGLLAVGLLLGILWEDGPRYTTSTQIIRKANLEVIQNAETVTALPSKSRLIVMADMGNEPDEEQQMAHLLMYANKVDLEGLIACSGKYLHADRKDGRTKTRPDLFHKLVDGHPNGL